MTASPAPNCDVRIREYREEDEAHAVALLQLAFGTWPRDVQGHDPTDLFRWKHTENSFGRSVMLVAESNGAVIAFGGWMRWRMTAHGQDFEVLRTADVAVHPAYRRQGVWVELLRSATTHFPQDIAFTLATPNELSRPGSLRVGAHELGVFRLLVRASPLRRAIRLATAGECNPARDTDVHAHCESAADVLRDGGSVSALVSRIERDHARFSTVKSLEYLRWRYGTLSAYRAMCEHRNGDLAGIAIFRIRRRGQSLVAVICEVLVERDDRAVAHRLLKRVVRAAASDYVVCHFPQNSAARQAAVRCGFLPVWSGPAPTVRALRESMMLDPTKRASWAICLGDVDLV